MSTLVALTAKGLTKRYGGLVANDAVSMTIAKGEVRGLIGPNGAGKTTFVNLITGIEPPDSGRVSLDGHDVTSLGPNEIAQRGLVRSFQVARVFANLTVRENLLVPYLASERTSGTAEGVDRAAELLRIATLEPLADGPAAALSGGQRMLLMVCAGFMMPGVALYVLDEPFAGINPVVKDTLIDLILHENKSHGTTFLIVSHEMEIVRRMCPKVTVMIQGKVAAEGSLDEVARREDVITAYLGAHGRMNEAAASAGTHEALLSVSNLHCGYVPEVDILRGMSLTAHVNAITLVIGPNGAGKSTLLRAIFGLSRPHAGSVTFAGRDALTMKPSELKAAGISYVTQDINSFPQLSVEENLLMGAWVFRRDKARIGRELERVYATFPALAPKRRDKAGSLSGGQGRMLSVAREMMSGPTLLLIDEPTVGLAPNLVAQVYEILQTARRATDAAILLVEQNIEQALPLADHLVMLNLGQVKAEGPGREFDNKRVRALIQECLLG